MELKFILESILFSAQQPLSPKELRELLVKAAELSEAADAKAWKKTSLDEITEALEQLARDHEQALRSYRLACVAGSWQFFSQPEYAPWLQALVGHKSRPPRLSQPALETLAIIAYRQPVTRAEIEQVRGVAVDGVMATLLERGLVEQIGRAEVPGRPITYGTTAQFLEYFGLSNLEALPAADELRRVPITKPETLLTAEPGLATVPPEQLTLQPEPAATPPEPPGSGAQSSSSPGADQPQGEAAAATPAAPAAEPAETAAEALPETTTPNPQPEPPRAKDTGTSESH